MYDIISMHIPLQYNCIKNQRAEILNGQELLKTTKRIVLF